MNPNHSGYTPQPTEKKNPQMKPTPTPKERKKSGISAPKE